MTRSRTSTDAVFGAHVRAMRLAEGWSGRELARKAGVSVSIQCRVEHGESVTLAAAAKMALALGATIDSMITEPLCFGCADLPPRGFTCNACGRSRSAELPAEGMGAADR